MASVSVEEDEVDQITTPTIKTSKVTTAPPTRYMFLICSARPTHQYFSLSWSPSATLTYSSGLFGEPLHQSALTVPALMSTVAMILPGVVTITAVTCIALAAFVSAGRARPVARGRSVTVAVFIILASTRRVARFPSRLRCIIIVTAATFICRIRFMAIVRGRLGVRTGMYVLLRRAAVALMFRHLGLRQRQRTAKHSDT